MIKCNVNNKYVTFLSFFLNGGRGIFTQPLFLGFFKYFLLNEKLYFVSFVCFINKRLDTYLTQIFCEGKIIELSFTFDKKIIFFNCGSLQKRIADLKS